MYGLNQSFYLTGVDPAVALLVPFAEHKTVAGWRILPAPPMRENSSIDHGRTALKRTVFYWGLADGVIPFMAPLNLEATLGQVQSRLESLTDEDYGPKPRTDGSTAKTVCVYGHHLSDEPDHFYESFSVEPFWTIYGK